MSDDRMADKPATTLESIMHVHVQRLEAECDEARRWARKLKAKIDALGAQRCANCVHWDNDSDECIMRINSRTMQGYSEQPLMPSHWCAFMKDARDPQTFCCSEWESWE
jgi:hypothetical protein